MAYIASIIRMKNNNNNKFNKAQIKGIYLSFSCKCFSISFSFWNLGTVCFKGMCVSADCVYVSKILGIFPALSISHQKSKSLFVTLQLAGVEVILITQRMDDFSTGFSIKSRYNK
ncbi:Translation initiation factor IF-2 [Platysternon megacephalum]|uniref:Translation initiation factor IF-2 n=1 Tax=Platysternon megacephalum TaxID=55544 RepID=A0A4D9EGK4_9SAUR|nr:Translation initiation factor IF-2 [Platysternon megacephalum]